MSVSMSVRIEKQIGRSAELTNFEDAYAERKALDRAAKAAGVASLFTFVHSLGEEAKWAAKALGNPDTDAMSPKEETAFHEKLRKARPRVGSLVAMKNFGFEHIAVKAILPAPTGRPSAERWPR